MPLATESRAAASATVEKKPPEIASTPGSTSPVSEEGGDESLNHVSGNMAAGIPENRKSRQDSKSPLTSAPPDADAYIFVPPLNSPFYHAVVSPFCAFLVDNNVIPLWVTPNHISFAGLVFAVLSVFFARLGEYYLVAPCWILYALFDNLDGKQARRTNASSKGGDFVDHAIDSVVASLSALIILCLLTPSGTKAWVCVILTMSSQFAFFLGCWAHLVLGRLLLGTQLSGTDIFTVDELNFIVIPLLCLARIFFPFSIDYPCIKGPLAAAFLGSTTETVTAGLIAVHAINIGSCFCSITVIFRVYQRRVAPFLYPGLCFAAVSCVLLPPILLSIPCFSLMAFELITYRLKHKTTTIARIWQPVIVFTVISAACRFLQVDVTWGLSNPITAMAALTLCSATLALLIHYKDALNLRSDS